MPAHSMDSLFRSLNKGELEPTYYLYGSEDLLKDEAVRAIVDRAVDPSVRDFNFDQRSAAQLDVEEVHSLCNTLPMLAERRVVVIRDVEQWRKRSRGRSEFLRYLERPSPQSVVILVQGSGEESEDRELSASTYTVRFERLPPERATKWLLREASKLGVSISPEAAEHLVRSVGPELGPLAAELGKLASLPAGEPLTVEQVGDIVGVRRGETVWDWRRAVLEDQPTRAIGLLPAVLAQPGMSGVKLMTTLGTALIGLGIARAHYDRGLRSGALEAAISKSLMANRPAGLLPYREEARRWSALAPRWPARRIGAALRSAREADEALKSTTISDERGLLSDLVLRLGIRVDEEGGEDGKDGKGGEDGRMKARSRYAASASGAAVSMMAVLSAFSVLSALPLHAQTDPRLIEAVKYAQEGQSDSARMKVRRLLAATPPADSLYPQILYTQAMVSSDADAMRRQLQQVAVEYPTSAWADDALLRLVQLDYASGNLEGSARNLERIRLDYPESALMPQAAYWAARTYFDQKNPVLACRWLTEGLAEARGNIEAQNQLGYLDQRCATMRATAAARPAADSPPALATVTPDTVAIPAARPDTTPRRPHPRAPPPQPATPSPTPVPPVEQPAPMPAPPQQADTVTPPVPAGAAPAPSAALRYRIQVTAMRSAATAEATLRRLEARGFDGVTVEEGGLYKVRVGNYATRPEAVAALPGIKAQLGGSPFVVESP